MTHIQNILSKKLSFIVIASILFFAFSASPTLSASHWKHTEITANSSYQKVSRAQTAVPTGELAMATQVLNLVNQERAKVGAPALKLHKGLQGAATLKSKDMAVNKYFSHQSPTYGSPFDLIKSRGISYTAAGENIAAGQTSASAVMKSWMNSPGHKANILSKNYTHIGIGIYKGGAYGIYHTQLFIRQ